MPVKKEEPKFQLNLFDLDFLEASTTPTAKTTGSNKNITTQNNNVPAKVQTKGQNNQNFMSVPSDVVKKLQQGNDSFIVAYNPVIIPPQQTQLNQPPQLPQQKV